MQNNARISPIGVVAVQPAAASTASGDFHDSQFAQEAERAARYRLVIEEGPHSGSSASGHSKIGGTAVARFVSAFMRTSIDSGRSVITPVGRTKATSGGKIGSVFSQSLNTLQGLVRRSSSQTCWSLNLYAVSGYERSGVHELSLMDVSPVHASGVNSAKVDSLIFRRRSTRYSLNSQLSGFPGSQDNVSVTIVGFETRSVLGAGAFSKQTSETIMTLVLGLLNGD